MSIIPKHLNAVGQIYNNFKVIKAVEIHELQCFLRELVHQPTGAHIIDIANEDPENLFCLSFQTLPENSNGVAHILEHTVLCGSKKYPVKDPFFSMNRRSLNTFMNALTGSDFTCYPAATQIPKDFYNLLEVYLDAVFHPNLNEMSFLQEGHRLEFATPEDPNSPLVHKGIVFNEMKGALSSATARLSEAMNQALFPDLPYGFNSGGDPQDIPKLTYEELREFHQKYYNPSRCLFFFYGNMPLEGHLDFLEQHAFANAKKVSPLPPLPVQPRFTEPRKLNVEFPISPDEEDTDKALISFGWLTSHILDQLEVLAICILEIILMDTDASPLKLAFLKSGLCKQASVSIDIDISEVPVIIVLRGCNVEDADALEKVLRNTLTEVANRGFTPEEMENALHQLEFFRSEIGGNHSPFGLSLFMRSGLLKQHGGKPEEGLVIHTLFDQLRKKNLEDPHYFKDLLRKHFLDNTHFVRIVMIPNSELAAKEVKEEEMGLAKKRQELNASQLKQIAHQAQALLSFQKELEDEDTDILPKLSLDDVPKVSRQFALKEEKIGPLTVFHHTCFTNSIVYVDLVFNLPEIAEEDLFLLRFFTLLFSQMGCGDRNYLDTLHYIQAYTGGVGAFLSLSVHVDDPSKYSPALTLRGKALQRNVHKLFPLFIDMINKVDFSDTARLKEVLLKHYTSLYSSLSQNALKYSINLSSSALEMPSRIANSWYGLEYYWKIKELVENIDKELPTLSQKLQKMHSQLLGLNDPHLVLSCDAEAYDELKSHHFYGLQKMATKSYKPWKGDYSLPQVASQGRIISSPVAFTSRVIKTIPYVHPDSPALSVAACLFDNLTLHPTIREQGGAYGGGAMNNTLAGNFYFYSYRDPNITKTLQAFEAAVNNILAGGFDDSDLEEAQMEIFQTLDAPAAPGSRADIAYGWIREGKTTEVRQNFRNRLLALTKEDVIEAVRKHIAPNLNNGATVVMAGKELLERENKEFVDKGQAPLPIEAI